MEIRNETENDIFPIWNVHATAFPTRAEADLVDRLRGAGNVVFSLIADLDGQVVGHVLFSRMVEPSGFLALAPVAVLPQHRQKGFADKLIREGLARAKADGWTGIFVLGASYYQRFGFDPGLAEGFSSPYAGPHFMALSLVQSRLPIYSGPATYPQAFAALG